MELEQEEIIRKEADRCELGTPSISFADLRSLICDLDKARLMLKQIRTACAVVVGDVEHETALDKMNLILKRRYRIEAENHVMKECLKNMAQNKYCCPGNHCSHEAWKILAEIDKGE